MTGIRFCLVIAAVGASAWAGRPSPVMPPRVVVSKPEPVIQQTSWRAFYNKLPDTVTLNFSDDTVSVLTSNGVPALQSTYKYKDDIVSFKDIGGLNSCADLKGTYHVKINGDTLLLVIDEDPCDARAGMLIIKPWIRKH